MQNVKLGGLLAAFLILNFTFLIPTPAQALEVQILPTPGETCKDDACRKAICPGNPPSICTQGKCVVAGGNPAASTIPCNYTLDELVLTGVNLSKFIFGITGSLALLFIAYGGYQLLTSIGNPEHIQKARGTLTAAFIGLIIILAATIFVRFISVLLGVEITGKGELGKIPVCIEGGGCPTGMERFVPTPPATAPCTTGQVYCVPE